MTAVTITESSSLPQNGTYQFSANFFGGDDLAAADLSKNDALVIGASNGGNGSASLSVILDLKEGDQVYLMRPFWVEDNALYHQLFTMFSGILLLPEI